MLREFIHLMSVPWAIDMQHAFQLAQMAYLVRHGQLELKGEYFGVSRDREIMNVPFVEASAADGSYLGKVAIHEIEGTLTRSDWLCGYGMIDMADRIREADNNPEVDAHVIRMHTPGGSVEGTEYLADSVKNVSKPLIVYGEDILSGGMYIAAGSDHIMLSGKNARVGSIGVQISYHNFSKYLEEKGISIETIRATKSQDKNKFDLFNLTDEDRKRLAEEALDPIDENFMNHVRENRLNVDESALSGNVYFAEQAIKLGLADSIGTFEDAVQLALDMAGKADSSHPNQISMSEKSTKVAEQPEKPAITADEQAYQNRIAEMEKLLSERDSVIARQSETISELVSQLNNQQKQINHLSQLPAADPETKVASPEADISTKVEKVPAQPAPEGVMKAIERSRRRSETATPSKTE